MASLTALRTGLGKNLGTIRGLRVAVTLPDNPTPPMATIQPDAVTYDSVFGRGMQEYRFTVLVMVGRVAERSRQNELDEYISSTGGRSIKLAIESDKTLGGIAYDVRVSEMRLITSLPIGDVNYLTAEFTVLCYAD